ncbi:MAG: hypothetical protein ACLFVU_09960 [Phycisphaerae bacterium]
MRTKPVYNRPTRTLAVILLGFVAAVAAGCGAQRVQQVPTTVSDYRNQPESDRLSYPPEVVLLHNLQRVMDDTLPDLRRRQSMEVVAMLGNEKESARRQLASLLSRKNISESLRMRIMEFLLDRNYAEMSGLVVGMLPELPAGSRLREKLLRWLERNPHEAALPVVLAAWAEEPTGEANDRVFREIVGTIGGRRYWDQVLLDKLAQPEFEQVGAALEILVSRLGKETLRQRLKGMSSASEAVAALKLFENWFEYLPDTRQQYRMLANAYRNHREDLDLTSRLAQRWSRQTGYQFGIRDFHLLHGLATDPDHVELSREALIRQVGQAVRSRRHANGIGGQPPVSRDFWRQRTDLNMADLWNLLLVNRMLEKPKVIAGLEALARRDRNDRRGAYGGLIFYENGKAEAKVYPGRPADDGEYRPTDRWVEDSRDSLMTFVGHFSKINNAANAGPDSAERRLARENDRYGLTITSVGRGRFSAHYYNPKGKVISLGIFEVE